MILKHLIYVIQKSWPAERIIYMTREQLGNLVLASEDLMYHVAKTLLYNDADCSDAIQETIVKAFSKVHTLKEDVHAKTWMIRILINECYGILRRNQRLEIWGGEEFEQSGNIQMSNELFQKEQYSELYEALSRLPEEMRLTVTLYYLEGYHVKEIADILDTTESTVKNRLLGARNRLKRDLEEMEANVL